MVGGTAIIVFSIIGVIGIHVLSRVDLRDHGAMFTLASGLAMGLMPILVPGIYTQFPQWSQMILGNGLAMGTITAALVNAMFQLTAPRSTEKELA